MSDGDAEPDEEDEPDTGTGSPGRPASTAADGEEESPDPSTRDHHEAGAGDRSPETPVRDGSEADPGVVGADRVGGTESRPVGAPASRDRESGDGDRDPEPDDGVVSPEEIDVEELTGPVRKLDPKVRYVWVLGSVMGSLVLAGMAGAVGFVVFDRPIVGPAVFLFLLGLGAVLAVLRYRSWSYEVREDSLYLERGVLTHTRTVVPYVRIQHVDASRGPVERTLGLATAVVYTAGSRGADVSIPGLTTDRADDLQERLKRLAIAAEGEDAV